MDRVKREYWIDDIKIFACILVVLGHFFQSMTKSGILPDGSFFDWFDQTIYYFHVPLFFICSGYLYQKTAMITDISSWGTFIGRKALTLGVPYFTFSTATWVLKTVFSGSVNDRPSGLLDTLFAHPASPYWYLYCLFFLFVFFIPMHGKRSAAVGILIAAALQAIGVLYYSPIKLVEYVLNNSIWFVSGMSLYALYPCRKPGRGKAEIGCGIFAVFLVASLAIYQYRISFMGLPVLMGIAACAGAVMFAVGRFSGKPQGKICEFASRYTMPVFLMHTLCAAPVRVLLSKIGVHNGFLHVVCGLSASFLGPIILAEIMKKSKWLEFFIYPGKVLKI